MSNAKKPENNKAASQTAADNKPAVKVTPAADVKTDAKITSAAPAAKTTPRASAKKTATKPVAADKKTAAKPAAKKTAAKSAAKTSAKTTAKPVAKTAAKKPAKASAKPAAKAPAKRGGRKPAPVTIDTICAKLEKKIGKTKAAAIKEKIAVEIEVWGFEDGSNAYMYIEVNDGKVTVSPHNYDAKSFRVSLSFANAVAFVDGKTTLKKLVESGDFYAEGNIASAVKLAAIF